VTWRRDAGVTDELHILHDVVVFDVVQDGPRVLVDLYGSEANVCGSVRFGLHDPGERASALGLLRRWCRDSTPLTLVMRPPASSWPDAGTATVTLQNDRAVFGAQLLPRL
jgi:hypothetical protein